MATVSELARELNVNARTVFETLENIGVAVRNTSDPIPPHVLSRVREIINSIGNKSEYVEREHDVVEDGANGDEDDDDVHDGGTSANKQDEYDIQEVTNKNSVVVVPGGDDDGDNKRVGNGYVAHWFERAKCAVLCVEYGTLAVGNGIAAYNTNARVRELADLNGNDVESITVQEQDDDSDDEPGMFVQMFGFNVDPGVGRRFLIMPTQYQSKLLFDAKKARNNHNVEII